LGAVSDVSIRDFSPHSLRAVTHRAEFPAEKFTTTQRLASLAEKDGSAIFDQNRKHDEWIKGEGKDKRD
jgi:hypothetical protein